MLDKTNLPPLLEALLLAAGKPLREEDLLAIFSEEERPSKEILREALKTLADSYESRGIHLQEIASGYQFQVNSEWAPFISRLWEEKAPRYSRALLETLALIAYRQPITRGDIEDIRGVSISQSIFKTLLEEREWIRVVGHREVPGKPALYATTKLFLDYFGLKTLEELPSLPEIMNLDNGTLLEDEKIEQLMQNAFANHPDQDKNLEIETEDETETKIESKTEPEINTETTAEDLEKRAFADMVSDEESIELLDFEEDFEISETNTETNTEIDTEHSHSEIAHVE